MELVSTPVRIEEHSIRGQARRKGGLLGMVMVRQPLSILRLEYKKYFRFAFPYEVLARIFPFRRKEIAGKMEVFVDAVSGNCAVNTVTTIELVTVEGLPFMEGAMDMEVQEAHDIAHAFGKRIVTRIGKTVPTFDECPEPEHFYRPVWIAYYGDPEDKTCRYLPFEADGHTFKR